MRKPQKRFEFLFPLTEKRLGAQIGESATVHTDDLYVSYVGYDHGGADPDERFEVDVDVVEWDGINITPLMQSNQFEDVMEDITEAAMNNVSHAFEDHYAAKADYEANMLSDLKREEAC